MMTRLPRLRCRHTCSLEGCYSAAAGDHSVTVVDVKPVKVVAHVPVGQVP